MPDSLILQAGVSFRYCLGTLHRVSAICSWNVLEQFPTRMLGDNFLLLWQKRYYHYKWLHSFAVANKRIKEWISYFKWNSYQIWKYTLFLLQNYSRRISDAFVRALKLELLYLFKWKGIWFQFILGDGMFIQKGKVYCN